jgi:hypothetical protein
LAAFETVKESLDQIHSNVKGMSDSCRSMQVGALRGISRPVSSAFAGLGSRILLNFQQLFSKKHNILIYDITDYWRPGRISAFCIRHGNSARKYMLLERGRIRSITNYNGSRSRKSNSSRSERIRSTGFSQRSL